MCVRKVSGTSEVNNVRALNKREKTFRLLNRDKFSFRPHVFFGVVKVSVPKEVL